MLVFVRTCIAVGSAFFLDSTHVGALLFLLYFGIKGNQNPHVRLLLLQHTKGLNKSVKV